MIYKVLYQEDKLRSPQRELTKTLYTEADSESAVRQKLEQTTHYNIELIQALSGNFLEYEKNSVNFKLTVL